MSAVLHGPSVQVEVLIDNFAQIHQQMETMIHEEDTADVDI